MLSCLIKKNGPIIEPATDSIGSSDSDDSIELLVPRTQKVNRLGTPEVQDGSDDERVLDRPSVTEKLDGIQKILLKSFNKSKEGEDIEVLSRFFRASSSALLSFRMRIKLTFSPAV